MKKTISLLLSACMMAVMMAGCGGGKDSSAAPESSAQSAPSASAAAANADNKLEKIKSSGKIVLATSPDYPPYEFQDLRKSGQDSYVGADIELARYIAKELGVELEIKPMEFSAVLAAVTEGKVDIAISGLAYKPERAETMEMSDPYNKGSEQGIIVLKDQTEQFKTLEDFNGKKIAVQNGSLQQELVAKQLPGAEPVLITALGDAILMLKTGKIDAIATATNNGEQFCKNYDDIVMSTVKFDYNSEGTRVGITKGQTELLEAVNGIIAKVNEQDLYQTWVEEGQKIADELGIN